MDLTDTCTVLIVMVKNEFKGNILNKITLTIIVLDLLSISNYIQLIDTR